MRICVVRHGQTNYNVLGLHNADPKVDVHLTEDGIAEAKRLAEELKNEEFDVIYISELPRTRQTAEYINECHYLPVAVDARLNDINSGFEGQKVVDYHAARDASDDPFTYRYPGAKSSEDVFNRTKDFLENLKNSNFDNVLVVTSKHNLRHFRNIIDGLDPRETLQQHVKTAEVLIREI